MVNQTSDVERLAAEIRARATSEAEEIRQMARDQADDVLTRARQESEAEARQRLAVAEKEARATIRRTVSTAEVAAQRLVLEAREKLIDRALELAWQEATGLTDVVRRRESLLGLVVEAVAALGGGEVSLRLNAKDRALATPEFLAEARDLLTRAGTAATLGVAAESVPIAGGVIATKERGRVLFDNSFEARLDRLCDVLREAVWRVLVGQRPEAVAA